MRFSVHHATNFTNLGFGRAEVLRSASIVEKLGCYYMNSVQCHINWYPNTAEVFSSWIMAAELAAVATRYSGVGIIVTDVFRTHPVQIALNALHLQRILGENRKFILGLGAGEGSNLTDFGINWDKKVSKLEEAIQVIKLLFESSYKNKVGFEGNYFNLDKVFLQMPVKTPPKIWLAAGSPRTLKIAAKHADGWIPVGCTPKLYEEQLKTVVSRGRNIEKAYNAFIYISKTEPEKAKQVMDVVSCVQSARPEICAEYEVEVPKKLDFIKHFNLPLKKQKSHQAKVMEFIQKHIPREVRMGCVLAGSPDEIIEQLQKWADAGLEHCVVQFWGDDYWNSLKLFADEVVPQFK